MEFNYHNMCKEEVTHVTIVAFHALSCNNPNMRSLTIKGSKEELHN